MMSSTPNSNLSPRHRSGAAQRSAVAVLPAVIAIVWLSADFVFRSIGFSETPWMKDVDIIALLVLVVGAATLALQAKVQQVTHSADDFDSEDSTPTPEFHIADGGTRLPVKKTQRGKYVASSPRAPLMDGGMFPKQRWGH
jgi:hypothetical protein